LTLLFLPALYVAWFRIQEEEPATDNAHENLLAAELQSDRSANPSAERELKTAFPNLVRLRGYVGKQSGSVRASVSIPDI
jgi:hypothetical protein